MTFAHTLLQPADMLALFRKVTEGRVYDLSHTVGPHSPHLDVQPPYQIGIDMMPLSQAMGAENGLSVFVENVQMTFHVGTHIDAIGHFAANGKLYGGRDAAANHNPQALKEMGIDKAPAIVTRGVVIDLATAKGADLGPDEPVDVAHLERVARAQGIAIKPKDVVLVRTGWGRHYGVDNATYIKSEPGLTVEAARWLSSQGVAAVGADNMALEVLPWLDPKACFPVHGHLLAEAGVHIIENLRFDDVVAANVKEFLFVLLPVKFTGATGSPSRPIAIV